MEVDLRNRSCSSNKSILFKFCLASVVHLLLTEVDQLNMSQGLYRIDGLFYRDTFLNGATIDNFICIVNVWMQYGGLPVARPIRAPQHRKRRKFLDLQFVQSCIKGCLISKRSMSAVYSHIGHLIHPNTVLHKAVSCEVRPKPVFADLACRLTDNYLSFLLNCKFNKVSIIIFDRFGRVPQNCKILFSRS